MANHSPAAMERTGPDLGPPDGPDEDRPDVAAGHGAEPPTDVIGMCVRDRDDGQAIDVQAVEASIDGRRLRSDVDQHRRPVARGHDRGVALADVARHHHPAVGRPPHLRRPPHADGQADRESDHDGRVVA